MPLFAKMRPLLFSLLFCSAFGCGRGISTKSEGAAAIYALTVAGNTARLATNNQGGAASGQRGSAQVSVPVQTGSSISFTVTFSQYEVDGKSTFGGAVNYELTNTGNAGQVEWNVSGDCSISGEYNAQMQLNLGEGWGFPPAGTLLLNGLLTAGGSQFSYSNEAVAYQY